VDNFQRSDFFCLSIFRDGYDTAKDSLDTWNKLASRFESWKDGKAGRERTIPKKIHQIWIGKKLPEAYEPFCESWRKFNPSYEYRLWNEEAILGLGDFEGRTAFRKARSLGAKSDIARYEILRRFGGIYADTDFECLKSFDPLTDTCGFFVGNLFADVPYLCNAIIASSPGHPVMDELCLRSSAVVTSTEPMDVIEATGPGLITKVIIGRIDELGERDMVFPSAYLYPYPNFAEGDRAIDTIKRTYVTSEAYAIHYWEVSWGKVDFVSYLIRKFKRAIKKIRRMAVGES
jgi:inositol phosphorylceramide mannosyltransferase catalytic subunit